jgi:hypothetical protein
MLRRAAFPLLIALLYFPFCLAAAAHPAPIVLDVSVTIVESAQESGPGRRRGPTPKTDRSRVDRPAHVGAVRQMTVCFAFPFGAMIENANASVSVAVAQ